MSKSRLASSLMDMIKRRKGCNLIFFSLLLNLASEVAVEVVKASSSCAAELSANLINTLDAARPFTWSMIIYLN